VMPTRSSASLVAATVMATAICYNVITNAPLLFCRGLS
jgi:hypothetical protein